MKSLTTRWYFTLRDLAELYNLPKADAIDRAPTEGLGHFCGRVADVGTDSPWLAMDTDLSRKMWSDYLWPEFADAAVLYVDEEVDPWTPVGNGPTKEEVDEVLRPMLPAMVRWLRASTERYSVLISAYEETKNKLMSKVETVSSAENTLKTSGTMSDTNTNTADELHNDTPQNGGNFTADPYVSDAHHTTNNSTNNGTNSGTSESSASTTTSSDVTTPIARLNEVREKLRNLYADWAAEFARFVVYTAD